MRQTNDLKSSRLSTERIDKSQVTGSRFFRAATLLSLVAVALIALTLYRQAITTAQAQQSTEIPEAASLFETNAWASRQTTKPIVTEQPTFVAPAGNPSALAPDGSVCGWSASTVHPVTILDQATASVGSNLYTFGGVSTAIIANARKFDGTVWTDIAPLPAALEFPTAVSDGTNIYILGGALLGTGTPQTTLYRYNVGTNDYTTLAPFTTGTWNAAAVFLGGKIYKFAGTGPAAASTNVLEIYDVVGNTWTAGAPYPVAISFVGAFARGGFIYGAGGIQSVGSVASNKTYRYDPVGNTWDDAMIADLPATRWGAASSITGYGVNNGWVLAGGYVAGTATANISNTVIRWNPTLDVWDTLSTMVGERSRMTGAVLGDSFYVIGGRSIASSGFVGTNSNQKLLCFSGVAVINSGASALVSESYPPANMAPDPGETVTVSLPLSNVGDTATTALTATLQATGGVTSPSAAQNYGVLPPLGPSTTRNFTFRVDPAALCGSTITLTWLINDGATTYPNVVKTFILGTPLLVSEKFDGVVAPALPAGWTTTQDSGTAITWTTTTTLPSSAPNSAFANNPATVNMSSLVSPMIPISSTSARLSFKNKYITESTFDGMVLEIANPAVAAGAFQDIITAGGVFVSGGYNAALSSAFMNPLGGRMAWTGTSAGGFIDTVITLPATANGNSVQFRWRMASDNSVAATGVNIDDVVVLNGYACTAAPLGVRADFDGDGKTDLSIFRLSEGNWYLNRSTAGFSAITWGTSTDTIMPGDFDGDSKADEAVYRPSNTPGVTDCFVLRSSTNTPQGFEWGIVGDIPVVADYDGDGKDDVAVYRASGNDYFVIPSTNPAITRHFRWGITGDIPVPGDFDGDGKAEFAVFRPSTGFWYYRNSGDDAFVAIPWGAATDAIVYADYDGDGKDDIATYRPTTGFWYIIKSTGGTTVTQFGGVAGDIAVPGDYDGDGKYDIAIYRGGTWHVQQSTAGALTQTFGVGSDIPVPVRYLPAAAGGGAVTVSYTGAVVAIPDNLPAGVNINLPVTGAGTVADLNFSFDTLMGGTCDGTAGDTDCAVNHTWVGDLIFTLTPPDGSPAVTFYDRPGVPATGAGCSNNNLGAILLNDEGGFPSVDLQGNPTPGACNTALLFPTGNFSPLNPLSAFDGENSEGTWVLNVSDRAGADTGSVRRFSLVFNSGN